MHQLILRIHREKNCFVDFYTMFMVFFVDFAMRQNGKMTIQVIDIFGKSFKHENLII